MCIAGGRFRRAHRCGRRDREVRPDGLLGAPGGGRVGPAKSPEFQAKSNRAGERNDDQAAQQQSSRADARRATERPRRFGRHEIANP